MLVILQHKPMVLTYSFCNVARMPLRAEPSHRAEQVNELLFGERAEVLQLNDSDWALIRCEWDGYEGWCKAGQLAFISRREYRKAPKYITARHTDKLVFEDGDMLLPLGADLFNVKGGKTMILNRAAKYKGKRLAIKKLELTCDTIKDAALQYQNAPYLWGGRSVAGIDCSGLTQMAYKLCGKANHRRHY